MGFFPFSKSSSRIRFTKPRQARRVGRFRREQPHRDEIDGAGTHLAATELPSLLSSFLLQDTRVCGDIEMRKTLMIELLLAAAIFSGCAALTSLGGGSGSSSGTSGTAENLATASAPGPSLLNFAGRSTKFVFVSPAALLADSGNVERSLIQEQCMFHSADPPFLVPAFSQKWLFVGRMNQGPTIQALEYKTILTLGLTGPQQLNAWR
jgi:hypothetical protein